MLTSVVTGIGALVLATATFATYQTDESLLQYSTQIPQNYQSLYASEKQNILWQNIEETKYSQLPEFSTFGPLELGKLYLQNLTAKANLNSDVAPVGWKKYLHAQAAVAKVKIVPVNSPYTGVFQGAGYGLLRLSLTYRAVGKRPVAPGLALKILRDGVPSGNISALVSIKGQDKDFNFFKNAMSNIVPVGNDFGMKAVHRKFKQYSNLPEELSVENMAAVNAQGQEIANVVSPRQIFFVPGKNLNFTSSEHDVRIDMMKIQPDTVVYQIYAANESKKKFDYFMNYKESDASAFLADAVHIADIVTTSEFVASEFGDNRLFFKHQLK